MRGSDGRGNECKPNILKLSAYQINNANNRVKFVVMQLPSKIHRSEWLCWGENNV